MFLKTSIKTFKTFFTSVDYSDDNKAK